MAAPSFKNTPAGSAAGGATRPTRPAAWAALAALVVIGEVMLWLALPYKWQRTDAPLWAAAAVLPLVAIPPVRRLLAGWLDRLRAPSQRARLLVACVLGGLAAASALWRTVSAYQPLYPMLHDEHSYLLQAQHLAHFRLWFPRHELADFFESFHILVEPVYASIYWPGTGLMNVWGVWLGLPHYAMPLVLYALLIALTYLIAAECIDGLAGILAATILAAQPHLSSFATLAMSQVPSALLGASLLWAWLRWRSAPERARLAWTAGIGALAGWMAITRPVDAVAFALPVGVAMLWVLFREQSQGAGDEAARPVSLARRLALTISAGVLAATPLLVLQAALNYGTTGSILQPPYVKYLNLYQPGTEYGYEAPPGGAAPATTSRLRQKQDLYELFVAPELSRLRERGAWSLFWKERIPMTLRSTLPSLWLAPLALLGALSSVLSYRRRSSEPPAQPARAGQPICSSIPALALASVVLFVTLYISNPFYLSHYPLPLAAPMTLLVVAGFAALERITRGDVRRFATSFFAGVTAVGCALAMWQYQYQKPFDWFAEQADLTYKYRLLPSQPELQGQRALVLVRYTGPGEGEPYHWEPVYNVQNPWPDDAEIIWAHDLKGRREEILAYYAQHQPDRQVIFMDRTQSVSFPIGGWGARVTRALIEQRSGRLDLEINQPAPGAVPSNPNH